MRARARRHEAAHLRQQHDQRDLPDSVDLPAMLGPVISRICSAVGVEADVVGHEAARRREPLDHRVAAVGELDDARRRRPSGRHVAVAVRDLGERRQRVERRDPRAPASSSALARRRDLRAQRREELGLERDRRSSASRILLLELGQLGRDEALGVGERLLAHVVGRHRARCARVISM